MRDVVHDGPGFFAHAALADRIVVDAVEEVGERLEQYQRQHQPVHSEHDRTPKCTVHAVVACACLLYASNTVL